MKTIYFDESGFTGYNYLDPQQPLFAITSTDIEPDLAEYILKRSFPKYQSEEYKFSNIVNSKNEIYLTTFAKELKPYIVRCLSFTIDKRFAMLIKMIEYFIEPLANSSGTAFYKDGFNVKFANYVYVGLTTISKIDVYDDVLATYQQFSRNASKDSLKILLQNLKDIRDKTVFEVATLIDQMIEGARVVERFVNFDTYKKTNDLQLATMLGLVGRWRQRSDEDFEIIHDKSSNFYRNLDVWKSITKPDVPEFIHPLPDGTSVKFPLKIVDTKSEDSKINRSIQLCDIIAGFITQRSKIQSGLVRNKEVYAEALKLGLGELTATGIHPGYDFPTFPPPRKTKHDHVDIMSSLISSSSQNPNDQN
ncbi:hypothetical protein SMI01S_16000 [Sphingobacterium mizutaii NBRC 14946 = DSM 11724]|uniref:Protein of uncharacterized function (DUF3800) n=2 Tax=Sphingobacterium mizutaii TaxID=1010 RepID=A0AAJ4X859_9SPHI|nr:DUF3800 domain-containing protein [Sphingobacterium mizutaii]GEM67994.1 hypothetical protein SMI01S_16000 [Sphingobacterium mizutaii NBRC 14946 = DSM 11724]SDL78941.1 Protein of unknown function [Sphingobacterium mizutaii]SNV37520.1 Protein of uncharacterised function (DUF3800) [Sphingobacterium mizutaii]